MAGPDIALALLDDIAPEPSLGSLVIRVLRRAVPLKPAGMRGAQCLLFDRPGAIPDATCFQYASLPYFDGRELRNHARIAFDSAIVGDRARPAAVGRIRDVYPGTLGLIEVLEHAVDELSSERRKVLPHISNKGIVSPKFWHEKCAMLREDAHIFVNRVSIHGKLKS